jgi:translocation and assembly module TamA
MKQPFTILLQLILSLFYSATLLAAPVVTVEIKGVSGLLLTNVQQWLSIEQQREHPLLTEGRILQLHGKADQEINSALQPYGYYRPRIEKSLTRLEGGQWRATYRIELGEPLFITALEWKIDGMAADDEAFKKLWGEFPLQPSDVLNQARYEQAKRDLIKLANERGYFDATFTTARIAIDLKQYTAHITLHFNSGQRYRFGATALHQDVLDDNFLRRYIPYAEGDPYNIEQLLDLQRGLMGSDYFSVVELQPQQPISGDGSVPVVVNMIPRKDRRYLLALGYGTDTGPRAKVGLEVPRVNSEGHRFDVDYRVSAIGNSLNAHYRIPIRDPRQEQLIFSSALTTTRLENNVSRIATVGVSLLQVQGPWQETVSLNYHNESYTISDVERRTTLVMPGISLSRHLTSHYVLLDQGLLLSAEARGGAKGAFSDTNFFQGQFHLKGITSLTERQRLITRGTAGGTNALEFDKIPASLRFYAGGSESVRGYRYQSLGPTDDQGRVVGGKYLLTGSVEYELRLNQDWSWAVFADAGNAVNDFKTAMKQGSGTGVRWQTPVGPLRFDIAWAISEPDNPWRIHINIGPDL